MNKLSKQTQTEVGINKVVELNKDYSAKVRQIKNTNINAIRDFVDGLTALLTLPPFPREEPINMIVDFICHEFQDYTIEEMKLAFYKAKSRKMECNVEHYNKLDIDYVGKVLQAYRKLRESEIKLVAAKERGKKKIAPINDDPKVAYNQLKKIYQDENNPMIRLGLVLGNWNDAFSYAEEQGLIEITDEEKRDYFKTLKITLEEERRELRVTGTKSQREQVDSALKNMQLEARKRLLIAHFKEL